MMKATRFWFATVVALFGLALTACAPAATPAPEAPEEEPAAPAEEETEAPMEEEEEAPAEETGGIGTEERPFVFAFVPSGDADVILASGEAIVEVLAEKTGLVFEASVPTSYVGAVEALCAGEADAVALNTFSYIIASERGCAEVSLVSVRFGSPTYAGQLVAGADTGIESVEDLAGKTFCRPDPFSTSGWIIPSITMRAAGLDPENDLAEIVDAGGHDGVVRAIYDGDCDAGSTFVDARSGIDGYEDAPDRVLVIETSPPIPNDNVSFATDVPEAIREAVTDALVDMTANEEELAILAELYSWDGLEPVEDSFYDEFRQQLDAAGVSAEDFAGE